MDKNSSWWNNFLGGAKKVGSWLLKHAPTILLGGKTVAHFFTGSSNPMISAIAQIAHKGFDKAGELLDKYNAGVDVLDIAKEAAGVGQGASTTPTTTGSAPAGKMYTRPDLKLSSAATPSAYNGWRGGSMELD